MVGELQQRCAQLLNESNAVAVVLLQPDGREVAMAGDAALVEATSVRSFSAAAGERTVDLYAELGEKLHLPRRTFLHVSHVAQLILAVLFDDRTSLGLVRIRVKKATEDLGRIIEKAPSGSGGATPAAAEVFDAAPVVRKSGGDEPLH